MTNQSDPVICSVSSNGRNPILFLPTSPAGKALPRGDLPIVANGTPMTARVAKIAINWAGKPGDKANALPAVLRGWFGEDAGKPGRRERVSLRQAGAFWVLEPVSPVANCAAA